MTFTAEGAVTVPWLVLGAFWAITAASANRSIRSESTASRLYHVLCMTGVFALLFWRDIRIGQLGVHVLPASAQLAYAGLVLTSLGAAFAIWARDIRNKLECNRDREARSFLCVSRPLSACASRHLCGWSACYAGDCHRLWRSRLLPGRRARIRRLVVEDKKRRRIYGSAVWRRVSPLPEKR